MINSVRAIVPRTLQTRPERPGLRRLDKTEKQKEAIKLAQKHRFILLDGGGRSGKTFIILYMIVIRALMQKSDHLIVRFRFAHAKKAICFQTMPRLLEALGIAGKVKLNKTDWFYEVPNGSTIWIGGLDEKERSEKVLGQDYATIFEDEASSVSYDSHEILITRLVPPEGMRGLFFVAYNPPSTSHWGYKIFYEGKFPDGRPVPAEDYCKLKMNPTDNKFLPAEYLKTLESLSADKRRRFLNGEYGDDSGSLFQRKFFKYLGNDPLPDLLRVVVAVDPAGSVDGDEIGILVTASYAGPSEEAFIILDDYSCHGTPSEWAAEVAAAYDKWRADIVVAEKNFGGDMVEATIRNAHPNINVKLITSSRGKVVRAEPISALYEHSRVKHRIPFLELEDECCSYKPGISESPNRMDALVFGLAELTEGGLSMLDVL